MSELSPYQSGGTYYGLSYIVRDADHDLELAIIENRYYPFVLAPRQSGKSSLLNRALQTFSMKKEFHFAHIDFNRYTFSEIRSYRQFMQVFLTDLCEALNLEDQKESFVSISKKLFPIDDLIEYLVGLNNGRYIICIDEIDQLMKRRYRDDFFSQIRAAYNARNRLPRSKQVQFILSGAAPAHKLIKDRTRSPFNIGREILLKDLSDKQLKELVLVGWPGNWDYAKDGAERLRYWTNGQVFLCQKILEKLDITYRDRLNTENFGASVDEVAKMIFEYSQYDNHFTTIRNRLTADRSLFSAWIKWIGGKTPGVDVIQQLEIIGISSGQNPFRSYLYQIVFDRGGTLAYDKLLPKSISKSNVGQSNVIVSQQKLYMYDAFFAYDRKDFSVVKQIAKRLEELDGWKIWLEDCDLPPGDDFTIARVNALSKSMFYFWFGSKNSIKEWRRTEIESIPFRDSLNSMRRIIPILLDDILIPDLINNIVYIKWHNTSQRTNTKHIMSLIELKKHFMEQSAMLSKSSDFVSYRSVDPVVSEIDENDYGPVDTITSGSPHVWSVAISPDGKLIASGCDDKTIKVWDSKSNKLLATLVGHLDFVQSVTFTPDCKRIISGSKDCTIKVWSCKNYSLLETLKSHTKSVWSVVVSPDGKRIVSGSADKTVKIWDRVNYRLLATLEETDIVYCTTITPDGSKVISGSRDNTIHIWDIRTYKLLACLKHHHHSVNGIAVNADGSLIASCSSDGTIVLWDCKTLLPLATLEGHTNTVWSVGFSPDGNRMVSGGEDNTIKVWDRKSLTHLTTFVGHIDNVNSVAFTPNGSAIVSGSEDGNIKLWTLDNNNKYERQDLSLYAAAKVVIVGETSVGKSGLMTRLTEDSWRETASTHGMNVRKIPVSNRINDNIEKEIWLWDFAGQQDYKLIHQLFLNNTALAVLVYNPQDPKSLETLKEWDSLLTRAISPRPPTLLVAGRCDVGSSRESETTIQQFMKQHNFIGHVITSAKFGIGCKELKQGIVDNIPWHSLPVTSSPKRFKALKDNIYKLANTEERSLLIHNTTLINKLKKMMEVELFDSADLNAVCHLLEAQGQLFRLPYGDFWLLKPDMVNAYASSILFTARAESEVGCIDKTRIVNADLTFQHLGHDRLTETDEKMLLPAILTLMNERQITLEEDTEDGSKVIFPSVFRIARPTKPKIPSLAATYQFEGLIDDIYASLVVRLCYSQRFIKKDLWKDAADFITSIDNYPVGIALERKGDAKAEIKVYFEGATPEEEKNIFRRFIFEHLTNKSSEPPASVPLYFCPYCNWQIPYEVANKRLKAGKTEFVCSDCGESFAIALALESKPITKQESDALGAMDRAIHTALDNRSKALLQTGEVMLQVAITNQIFRLTTMDDIGIDAEIELLDDNGLPTNRRIYLQLKAGDSYVRKSAEDNREYYRIKNERILNYYRDSVFDVLLVIRYNDGLRYMNLTEHLRQRSISNPERTNDLNVLFDGKPFTADEILKLRKEALTKYNLSTKQERQMDKHSKRKS